MEVKIAPQDIDNVRLDQLGVFCASRAFNQRVTPEIDEVVRWVSADVSTDPKTRDR